MALAIHGKIRQEHHPKCQGLVIRPGLQAMLASKERAGLFEGMVEIKGELIINGQTLTRYHL